MIRVKSHTLFGKIVALMRFSARPSLFTLGLALGSLWLSGCASNKLDYTPKTAQQQEQDAVEHRVFYEGWFTR